MFMTRQQIKSIVVSAALVAAGASFAGFNSGCADTSAKRVETGGPGTITSIDRIDDQDWAEAARKLTSSMLQTKDLFTTPADGGKIVLAMSRITNNTSQVVDTDLLTKQIRVTLFNTGKVTVTTIGGLTTEDPLAKQDTGLRDFTSGNGETKLRLPTYTLSGKLIENQAKAGDIRQSTFYFQMTLTDKEGNSAWEGSTPITKIGSRNSVGL
jgi:hypothetical protein